MELYSDYIIIKPSNIQQLSGSSQTIPIDSIVTVSIVKVFLRIPYLQIVTPGMVPQKDDAMKGADANVVLIQPGNMKNATYVQEYVAQYKAKVAHCAPVANNANAFAALEKLDDLRKKGVITQSEFDVKKKQLLGL